MNELNMIWACRMYGLIHGLNMTSLYGFDMGYE